MLYQSPDGETMTQLGVPFYTRTNGRPQNTATGGSQVLIHWKDNQYVLSFYAADKLLPGRDHTYIDSNVVEINSRSPR
jgi:hypothetical protein